MTLKLLGYGIAGLAAFATVHGAGTSAYAAESFEGKQVKVIHVGSGRGSYAIYTRIFVRHFGRHIPGNPSVVADFMEGGGGLKGQNYLYNAAPKSGLVLGMPLPSVVTSSMIYPKVTRFVASEFEWLGNITQLQTAIGVWKDSPATTIEGVKKTEVIIASSGRTSELSLTPRLMNAVLGTKFKIVEGYKGMGGVNLAMENKEVHGRSGGMTAWHPLKPHWFSPENKIVFLAQLGMSPHPAIPEVPLVQALATNDADRKVLELMARSTVLTRPVAAPPGVSRDVVDVLVKAYEATMKDPAFLAEMKKQKMDMIGSMNRAEVIRFIAETEATPKEVITRFQDLLGLKG
jgi:tripartite-type tricarboxylate transporter receptor subunit TctC